MLVWFNYRTNSHPFTSCAPGTAERPLEQGNCGRSGVTHILAQHYQQQHKHTLATAQLLIGIFVCLRVRFVCACVCANVCVTLWIWILDNGRVLSRRKVSPSGSRVITREHRRDKKYIYLYIYIHNINGVTGQQGCHPWGKPQTHMKHVLW